MKADMKAVIYDTSRVLADRLRLLQADPRVCKANKDFILGFLRDKQAEGVTEVRATIICQHLRRLAVVAGKPFSDFTDADLKELMRRVEAAKWSEWTKSGSKTLTKAILKRLGWKAEHLEWIKVKRPINGLRSEDLLTAQEMDAMIATAQSPMWKALLAVMFDTGARPGEVLGLQLKDVVRNGSKFKLYVSGKTEKQSGARTIYVYKGVPLLDVWLATHPGKSSLESPLWIDQYGGMLKLDVLGKVYKRISRRAGIKKRNWPYLVRHTKLTEFYRDFGAILGAKLAGHVPGSREARTYLHLSESDIEEALDRRHGIKEAKAAEDLHLCPHCKTQNTYSAIVCTKCDSALNSAGSLKVEHDSKVEVEALVKDIMSRLLKPEVLDKLKTDTAQEQLRKILEGGS